MRRLFFAFLLAVGALAQDGLSVARLVHAEKSIAAEGCVRDPRLVKQTPVADLNTAALVAVSKWTFTPGTLDGVPVDVLFNISVNFRH